MTLTKILEATCVGGVVTAEGVPVADADILSGGIGESEGILLLDQDQIKYIASSAEDLQNTLTQISLALTNISAALSLLDAKPLGTLPAAPAAATQITAINAAQAQIDALKEILK